MPQFQPQRPSRTEPTASRARRRPPVRALVRALAVAGVMSHLGLAGVSPATAQGLPSGLNVVHGQASAVVKGNQMTVTNSANAVLNWQAFSVGAGQQVRFDQPAASSRVLNRVVGNDASQIFGSISSNGQVWLLNPRGVLFGRDARVDVGSLVVSTLGFPLSNWISGQGSLALTTMAGAGAAPIVNQGELRAASGGRVWLVGGEGGVRNEGLIAAPDGQVVLAAGRSVDLVDERLPHVAVRVSAPGAEVLNLGSVAAGGGRVDLLSAVVNQSGIVQADSMGSTGGVVRLEATESVQLGAGSVTSASGSAGGRVLIDAGPAGTMLAAGAVQATGSAGQGGEVQMLGRHVGLTGAAEVDASGAAGGGQVFVGGGLQGKDATLRNAEAVYFGPDATVRADATDKGDGGRIILWSDQATRAYGTLSARGGAAGGDGGFIETSGGWLDARPASVRTDAPKGSAGDWLLDPFNILVVNGYGGLIDGTGLFTPPASGAVIGAETIAAALQTTNVTISTGIPGSEVGDITMDGVYLTTGNLLSARSLTFNAAQDIISNSSTISTSGQMLTVNFNAGRDILFSDSYIESGSGPLAVAFTSGGTINMVAVSAGAQILTSGGPLALTFSAGSDINIDGAYISSTNGPASVSLDAGGNINISNYSLIYALGGALAMDAVAGLDINVGLYTWIYANGGPLSFTASAGGDFCLLDYSYIYNRATGDLTVSIDAGGDIDILNNSKLSTTRGSAAVTLGAGGNVNIYNSKIYSIDGSLAMTASAGVDFIQSFSDIYVDYSSVPLGTSSLSLAVDAGGGIFIENLSTILSYDGPMSVSLNAAGDVQIYSAWIGYSDPGQPLSLTVSAGGDLYLWEASIWGDGGPGSATFQAGGTIEVDFGSSIRMTGDDGVTLRAPTIYTGAGSFSIDSDGPVHLFTDNFNNTGFMTITSWASGTSILMAGDLNPNVGSVVNGGLTLNANGGSARWLVYLTDDTGNVSGFDYNFLQYGTAYPSAPVSAATGNGVLYSLEAALTVSNTSPITKVYDGTTTVTSTAAGLEVTGLRPGHYISDEGAFANLTIGSYASPNVDTGIEIGVNGFVLPVIETFAYGGPIPVYGYTTARDVRGDITPRTLTLSGVTAANKVYDGNRDATVAGGSLSNLVPGQTLGLTVAGALFDTANVGTAKPVAGTVELVDGSGLASNYQLSNAAFTSTADITPRPLTLTDVLVADKVYDATRTATLTGGSLANLVDGETLGLTLSGGLFDNANVGTGKPVTGTAQLANGSGSASNYQLVGGGAVAGTGNISARALTVSGVVAADKVYDGTRDAELSGGALGNLVAGQTLGFTLAGGLFDTANAGTNKPVTGTIALSDGSGLASNYVVPGGAVTATADITRRPLALSGVVADDKVYDGKRAATFTGFSLDNLVAGQTLGVTVNDGLFNTANVGVGKPVTGTAVIVDGSGLASNYVLTSGSAISTTAAIDPRPLTLSGVQAADKVYDGKRDATLTGGTLVNLVPGETLGLTVSGGLFDTANAGVDKPVAAVATLSDGSGLASNYVLANGGQAAATATIDPRLVTLSGVAAADKVYDGSRAATLSGGSVANLVAGETLGLALVGGFDTPNVGIGKPVNGTAVLVNGTGLASNYTLGGNDAVSASASITQRLLTVAGVLAADKVYDGNRNALLSGGSLVNVVPGETLTLTLGPGLFDTADTGVDKAVTGTATLGNGSAQSSNYLLASGGALATKASINPRSLTLSGVVAADKVYDSTRTAALSGGQLANLVAGESLGVGLTGGLFDTAGVGLDKPVTGNAALIDGSGKASNYLLSNPGVATSADISPALLQYVADPVTALQGMLPLVLSGQVSGFVAGETLATATTGSLGFATPASASSLPGSYAVDGYGLSAVNYSLAQASGNAIAMTILPPSPTVVAANEVAILVDSLRPESMPLPTSARDRATMRTLDALQGMRMDRQGAGVFGSIDIDAYSWDALAVLLESRSAFKSSVFDTAKRRLAADPGLADLPPCIDIADLEVGRCLVSDELLAKAESEQGTGVGVGALAGMTPPPPPKPVAAPTPTPAPAVAVAPPVAPAPTAPGPAATAPAPAPALAAPISVAVVRPKTVALAKAPPIPAPRAVRSAALPQIQRKIAVLVGLDNYIDDRIPLLENAGRDVEAVARVLETQLGYETVVVRDASREAIIGVLNKLALTARPNDSVIVYYAGHGTVVEETGLGYWMPASADAERPESWISNSDIGKVVGTIRASQVVLISDSCFSGSLVSERRVRIAGREDDPAALLQRRAAMVMSSGGNEPVADGARNGHSPFASSLMQSLSQLDNWRPGNTVFEQVRRDVTRRLPQTPHYGVARQGRHAEGADYLFEQRQLEQTLR